MNNYNIATYLACMHTILGLLYSPFALVSSCITACTMHLLVCIFTDMLDEGGIEGNFKTTILSLTDDDRSLY